jgi:hypothetical protein
MKMPWSLVTPVFGFVEPDMAATNCSVSMAGTAFVIVVSSELLFPRFFGEQVRRALVRFGVRCNAVPTCVVAA